MSKLLLISTTARTLLCFVEDSSRTVQVGQSERKRLLLFVWSSFYLFSLNWDLYELALAKLSETCPNFMKFSVCAICSHGFVLLWWSLLLPPVLWRCWLGGRKGIRPVKNWVVGCWCGYLSGARCTLPYGPSDATATHCLSLQYNPDWFYLSGTGSPG